MVKSSHIQMARRRCTAPDPAPRLGVSMRDHHSSVITAEQWRPIPGFSAYEVSDRGRVRSRKYSQPRVMKARPVKGYRAICLRRDNRSHYLRIARLVLETFVAPAPEGHEAAHLDGTKTNDALHNLAGVTHQENVEHKRWHGTQTSGECHSQAKLSQVEVDDMKRLRAEGERVSVLARRFGIHEATVYSLLAGKHWHQFEAKGQ